MKVQLVVVQGKPEGMVIPLAGPVYKIGRGEGCQLRPNSDLVSREHAEFTKGADSVTVQDLGSRNGTEVNGKKLAPNQPATLKTGDLIKVGTLTFAISIEGVVAAKPTAILPGGGRKTSLDDVSGDEIDAWLVSDETRPTPDRPSGVYGGDTITLSTYNGQEKDKAKAAPEMKSAPAPAARPTPPAPRPAPSPVINASEPVTLVKPAAPAPPPVQVPAPTLAQAPVPAPTPAPIAVPEPVAEEPEPMMVPVPIPAAQEPAPVPVAETPAINPLFDFVPDDLPEPEPESETDRFFEEEVEDDGIEDLSALQAADEAGDDPSNAMPDEFIDESNPFHVKKKEPEHSSSSGKPIAGAQDSSSAAGDILRKLLDRRRASKS